MFSSQSKHANLAQKRCFWISGTPPIWHVIFLFDVKWRKLIWLVTTHNKMATTKKDEWERKDDIVWPNRLKTKAANTLCACPFIRVQRGTTESTFLINQPISFSNTHHLNFSTLQTDKAGLAEVGLGGVFYVSGVAFFKLDGRLPFAHAIWHVFCATGAWFHFYAVYTHLYLEKH